ncbi:hypothetical protein F4820DRAFT_354333 [Hypoxylon rubiginosum]|uniref:Uncharacterized protein n=1 Tax=Hypoxylon rubiginosum TaxID=110542 RepID=A0ACB9YXN6_9PEZI|nr:hypothetical protein F4820DRAFT_354333 [Hypoxylon rubiginosum]
MGLSAILQSAFFDSRFKFGVHIVQVVFITIAIILSIVRISMPLPQRAHIMGIAIGFKSLVFISYQLLTEHSVKFRKWASAKANFILNVIELPFWGAVMGMVFIANRNSCTGASCGVSWAMAVVGFILFHFAGWTAVVTYNEYRQFKGRKTVRETNSV